MDDGDLPSSEKTALLSSQAQERGSVNVSETDSGRPGLWHRFGAVIVKPW